MAPRPAFYVRRRRYSAPATLTQRDRYLGDAMADLNGKTALVTGAASGIGLAAVELFAKRGAKVALNHLPDDARGPAAVARLRAAGFAVIGAPGDVSKPGAAEKMVGAAIDALG